jgi:hypothetical protein
MQSAFSEFLIEVMVVWHGNKWFDCTMDDMSSLLDRVIFPADETLRRHCCGHPRPLHKEHVFILFTCIERLR